MNIIKLFLLFLFCLSFNLSFAIDSCGVPVTKEEVWDVLDGVSGATASERLVQISEKMLGRPYQGGPCGEGSEGDFNKKPLATLAFFDCTTFVEAMLALSMIESAISAEKALEQFNDNIIKIKYNGNKSVNYCNRNHFTELDWLPDLNKKGILKDLTEEISLDSLFKKKMIFKRQWYEGKTVNDLCLPGLTDEELTGKLNDLVAVALEFPAEGEEAQVSYVPLEECLTEEFQKKLPDVSVFNLVKNEHTKVVIPTTISHQGLIIRKEDGKLYLRHASTSKEKKVMDTLFDDYVKARMEDKTWPTLGFNFQQILP